MKDIFYRSVKRIKESAQLACLGETYGEKVRVFFFLLLRSVKHSFISEEKLIQDKTFLLKNNGVSFSLSCFGTHAEFMLIKEVFVERVYRIATPIEPEYIIDCGANIGITTLYFHTQFPKAHIIALEPNPELFTLLMKNVEHIKNITPVCAAVGGHDGVTEFYLDPQSYVSSSLIKLSDQSTPVSVNIYSLQGIAQKYALPHIDIIKFDIEGAEYDMFRAYSRKSTVNIAVGEIHPDLMKASLEEFVELFKDDFEVTVSPSRKEGRSIMYATRK